MDNYLSGSIGGTRGAMYQRFQGKLDMIGVPNIVLDRILTASRTLFLAIGCLYAGVIASHYTDRSETMVLERKNEALQMKITALESKASVFSAVTLIDHSRIYDRVKLKKAEERELTKTNDTTDSASRF